MVQEQSQQMPPLVLPPLHIRYPHLWILNMLFQSSVIFQLFPNLGITLSIFKVHSNGLGHALIARVGERVYLTPLQRQDPISPLKKKNLTKQGNVNYKAIFFQLQAMSPVYHFVILRLRLYKPQFSFASCSLQ